VLLDAAKSGYRLVDGALEAVREKEGVVQGNVRLATVHTLSYYFTADVISDFVAERPRVNVSLMARSSPEVVELVRSSKADIGFVYDPAVASAPRKMLDGSGIKLEFAAEAETIDAMLRLVASEVGACVLPLRMPDSIIANYGLKKVSISRPIMKRRVAAITRADRYASGLVTQLLETATTRAFRGMP
jgi:DNA-binding transcriptional LysR family regulator